MKQFIYKMENMNEDELHNFVNSLKQEELKEKFINLIHHHITESKKQWDMVEDINEDKKLFRNLYLNMEKNIKNM